MTPPRYALSRFAALSLGFGLVAFPAHLVLAEDIVWDNAADPSTLQNTWLGGAGNDLAPSGGNTNTGLGYKSDSLSGNTVTIGDGPPIPGDVYGAINRRDTDSVSNNQVIINSGGQVSGDVYGGSAASGFGAITVERNTVTISGGASVGGTVCGGLASSDSGSATASNNIVTISNMMAMNGSMAGGAAGSVSGLAQASGNSLSISDSLALNWVNGGYAYSNSGAATATDNQVGITGGAVMNGDIVGGYGRGASGAITVARNTVTISGGEVNGNVYGGVAYSDSGAATATNNTVAINNYPVFSASTILYGGYTGGAGAGDAFTGNTLNKNSNVTVGGVRNFEFINFGYNGDAGIVNLDTTPTGSAQPGVRINTAANTITFTGTITGAGSLIKDGSGTLTLTHANDYTGSTEVRDGVLTLSGTGTISSMLALYDGATFRTGGASVNYLDQLDVHGSATWDGALNMRDGQTTSFSIPATTGNGDTMLTVTNGNANIADSTLTLGFDSRKFVLQEGDQLTLIDVATAGKTLTATPEGPITTLLGVVLDYTFDITATNKQLLATVTNISANEQTKSLSEGFVSGPALLNQTTDFVTGEGMAQAVAAADGGRPSAGRRTRTITTTNYGLGTFGAVTGGWSSYDTGSHTDLSSLSLVAGLAWGNSFAPGRLTLGAFFEYGNGSYDAYNSFADSALKAHGKGDIYHLGGGILGRLDFSQNKTGNFYAEASLRAGSVTNDYKNGNLNGEAVNYGTESAYYGAHAGLGYVFNLTKQTALDLYGKYFWTRQNGDSVLLSTDDPVRFADIDSHRLRIGGRFVYASTALINPYAGLAYEQEFGGEAKATVYGFAIDAPSLQGGTGIGELGLAMRATKDTPLSLDLGVQGYVGTREGITGSLRMRYDF